MKRFLILTMMLCACIMVASAQTKKEQKAAAKALQQEVARLTKEGWVVPAGKPLLSKQVARGQEYAEKEMNGEVYMATAITPGKTYDAARLQALDFTRIEIAGKIHSDIAGLIETNLGNTQLTQEEAESVMQSVGGAKTRIAQSLGRLITVIELYKILPNKQVQVQLTVAYDVKQAEEMANRTIREQLAAQSEEILKKVDNILDSVN